MGYAVLSKYRSELMGAAMLWVILFHAWNLDFGIGIINWFRAAGFGGVDIFIVLSGVGLVSSLSREEQSWSRFMARRCGRILPAYFLVMLPYTALLVWLELAPMSAFFFNSTLTAYWARAEGAFNWYVSGILLFYAVTPLCFRLLKNAAHRTSRTAIAMVLALVLGRYLMYHGGWHHMDVLYRVPVFFLGLLMGFYVRDDRKIGRKDRAFWGFWTLCGALYLVAAFRVDEEVFYLPLCHLFLFTTVPMCLVGCAMFEGLPLGGLRRALSLVGENSLEIYLLNVSFFSLNTHWQQYLDFGPGHYIYYLITIPLNILLGVLLHRCVAAAQRGLRERA